MIFKSQLLGGYECSTHRRRDGRRLDMIEATEHEKYARQDYARLANLGIYAARDGLRWHLIEAAPGKFNFNSVAEQIDAAQEAGVQVIWDIFHYGYPDDIDIFGSDFVARFVDFAAHFVDYYVRVAGEAPLLVPVNEISFFSWIAGDAGRFYPFAQERGDKLKRRLAAASIAASRAAKSVDSNTRIVATEPLVHVVANEDDPALCDEAERYRMSQFEALDMLTGRLAPDLDGGPDCVDMIGLNYYPHNQWYYPAREMIPLGHPNYRPLRHLLAEAAQRYELPIFLSETGTEDDRRVPWFQYVATECKAAIAAGVDLRGICLYPIVNHPGWEDERHCHNGLWDYCNENDDREIYEPLASEVKNFLSGGGLTVNKVFGKAA